MVPRFFYAFAFSFIAIWAGTFKLLIVSALFCTRWFSVSCGVENSTPSHLWEWLQLETLQCRVNRHPFCLGVKPWVFYCPSCERHCPLTIGATTGLVIATKRSPVSKRVVFVCMRFMKTGDEKHRLWKWSERKVGYTFNKMQNRGTERGGTWEGVQKCVLVSLSSCCAPLLEVTQLLMSPPDVLFQGSCEIIIIHFQGAREDSCQVVSYKLRLDSQHDIQPPLCV